MSHLPVYQNIAFARLGKMAFRNRRAQSLHFLRTGNAIVVRLKGQSMTDSDDAIFLLLYIGWFNKVSH